ncbi:tripartite tricarboxylate transporter substrate binding protein [Roseomonas sp. OT10]|uniref:Bug family tripartite tricarboxylate transporter substrate binding protein n=1 Tax=Roseomonas cutis TaxID=2897332 RepID=UPI001E2A4408|nr:tripartite tricarboxylate transporter substrate-binding protein [Roseomonas sp. OT10]UFN46873.1 tripartite tricarboxylate transporter substrate binding protein [Roseomonas sp. OT10]
MHHPFNRRTLFGAAAALAAPATLRAQAAWAPSRPIRIIVPFAAGGVADLTVRTVGSKLSERIGQPVVVDNRPSAGGIVAAQQLFGAAPDGHTLMAATNGTAISRSLFRNLPFDPLRDLAPVVTLGAFPIAVLVAPNGAPDMATLLARLRAEPGKLNIGTIAAGSTQNLSAELFKIRSGTKAETIAFPATPQAVTALLRGDVDAVFEITAPVLGQIGAGALRAVAVTTATRAATMPAVPTLQEAGVPDYDVASWNALVARTGTPPEVVAALNAAVNAVLAEAGTREVLAASGIEVRGGTPEAMGQLLATDTARWAEVIEKAGIEKQ